MSSQAGEAGDGVNPCCIRRNSLRARIRLRHRRISLSLLPSARRRATYRLVAGSWRSRVSATTCKARLSWRSPLRLIP